MELGIEGILNLKFLSNCHTQIQFGKWKLGYRCYTKQELHKVKNPGK
jgi:hypothetical protein